MQCLSPWSLSSFGSSWDDPSQEKTWSQSPTLTLLPLDGTCATQGTLFNHPLLSIICLIGWDVNFLPYLSPSPQCSHMACTE